MGSKPYRICLTFCIIWAHNADKIIYVELCGLYLVPSMTFNP